MARVVPDFRLPEIGRERLGAHRAVPRHRHRDGYITVVLAGNYRETGLDGRRDLSPGQVVVHKRYDAHLDLIGGAGAELLNLPLPDCVNLPTAFAIDDADAVARLAETDPWAAAFSICPSNEIGSGSDWPDLVASELARNPDRRLGSLASSLGIAPETLSRGFQSVYGVAPARFRLEVRARRAMEQIELGQAGLAAIAADCGYADQSHLTREIAKLIGSPPGLWQRSNSFKKRQVHTP